MRFVSRVEAAAKLRMDVREKRLRNYEIEGYLEDQFGGDWCVTDWCPFDGRFCKVGRFVPWPHPPMNGEPEKPPEIAVPWREWNPTMTTEVPR